MKLDVTAIAISRGIAIMASELWNEPTLHEAVSNLIAIKEVADALVHILEDLALTIAIAAPSGLVIGLRAFEACDGIVLGLPAACRFKRREEAGHSLLPSIRLRIS